MSQPLDDDGIVVQDDGHGKIVLEFDSPPYRTSGVARALGRMLLFELSPEFSYFDSLRDWVLGRFDYFPIEIHLVHRPGPLHRVASLFADLHTDRNLPRVIRVTFHYSNYFLIVAFPVDTWQGSMHDRRVLDIPIFANIDVQKNLSTFVATDNELTSWAKATYQIDYQGTLTIPK